MSEEVTTSVEEGLKVEVTVKSARLEVSNLSSHRDSPPNTYVVLEVGAERAQTSVKHKSSVPEWNETFTLIVRAPNSSSTPLVMSVLIYHRPLFGSDPVLAAQNINISNMVHYNRPIKRWFDVVSPKIKASQGEIQLEIFVTSAQLQSSPSQSNSISEQNEAHNGKEPKNTSPGLRKTADSPRKILHSFGKSLSLRRSKNPNGSGEWKELEGKEIEEASRSNEEPVSKSSSNDDGRKRRKHFKGSHLIDKYKRRLGNLGSGAKNFELRRTFSDAGQIHQQMLRKHESSLIQTPREVMASLEEINAETSTEDISFGSQEPDVCEEEDDGDDEFNKSTIFNDATVTVDKEISVLEKLGKIESPSISSSSKQIKIPLELERLYGHLDPQELLQVVCVQHVNLERKAAYIKELENYIDDLLVKVMETTPKLLQHPSKQLHQRIPLPMSPMTMASFHHQQLKPSRGHIQSSENGKHPKNKAVPEKTKLFKTNSSPNSKFILQRFRRK